MTVSVSFHCTQPYDVKAAYFKADRICSAFHTIDVSVDDAVVKFFFNEEKDLINFRNGLNWAVDSVLKEG